MVLSCKASYASLGAESRRMIPFKEGQDFEEWLEHYHHGGIILNIKSERIEFKVLQILEKKGARSGNHVCGAPITLETS